MRHLKRKLSVLWIFELSIMLFQSLASPPVAKASRIEEIRLRAIALTWLSNISARCPVGTDVNPYCDTFMCKQFAMADCLCLGSTYTSMNTGMVISYCYNPSTGDFQDAHATTAAQV